MRVYIIRRIVIGIFVLWLVTFLTFSMLRLVPGDIIDAMVSQQGTAYDLTAKDIRHRMGLDKPFLTQYGLWLGGLFRGDLGESLWSERPVWTEIVTRLPITVELGILALLISAVVAIPLGLLAAIRQDTPLDYGGRLIAIGGLSIPDFWLGIMVVLYLSQWFHYSLPLIFTPFFKDPGGNMIQMAFPAAILGFRLAAVTTRMMRSTMLDVLRQDYVRTAWAKGLRERAVILRHAMKNALIPVITIMGNQMAVVVGGTVILETVFNLNGVGRLTLNAINNRDYTQVQGNVLLLASWIVFMNLAVDLCYAWFDPRIRYR